MKEGFPVCIAMGLDGQVWEHTRGHWYPGFTPNTSIDLSFSCFLNARNKMACFTRGTDGAIWLILRNAPATWTQLLSMGGLSDQVPSCKITDANKDVCFFKGVDGFAYYTTSFVVGWTQVNDTVLSSKIRCFNDVRNTVGCVSLNADSEPVLLTWNGHNTTSWHRMSDRGIQLFEPPSCVTEDLADRVQCLGRRFDNQLVFSRRQDGVWSNWMSIQDEFVFSEVECVHVGSTRAACYYISDRMQLKSRVFVQGQWKAPKNFNLLYLEEPACTGVEQRAAICIARAVPGISKVICERLGN